jgi:hypothetical protein
MSLDTSRLENVRPTQNGFICACPICRQEGGDSTRSHLRIYTSSGAFSCAKHQGDREHNIAIRAFLRGILDESERTEVVYIEPKLDVETVYPESMLSSLIPDHSYWVNRGVKEEVLRRMENGIASSEEKGKLSGRSIFPLRNLDGKIIAFAGRLTGDSSFAAKWKLLGPIKRLTYPWHLNGAAIMESKTCILVESLGDTMALMSRDINNVLCIFGLNLGSKIIGTLLANDIKTVIISLNRDDDPRKGQAAADKIAAKLGHFFTDVRIVLPPAPRKDWGECGESGDDAAFDILRKEL